MLSSYADVESSLIPSREPLLSRAPLARPTSPTLFGFLAAATSVALAASPASALPIFAQQYGLACEKCHQVPPRLNAFGTAFQENGYRLPGFRPATREAPRSAETPAGASAQPAAADTKIAARVRSLETGDELGGTVPPGPAFPLAARIVFKNESDPGPNPHTYLDELELLAAGRVGSRLNYFVEQYLVDGGANGLTRDAWLRYEVLPYDARVPVYLTAGQFTLPLPIDPESYRETAAHYAIWDRLTGTNPFTFFDPKLGLAAQVGSQLRGTSATAAVLDGHDRQSGVGTIGVDTMLTIRHAMGDLALSLYRYAGRRPSGADPLAPGGEATNRFSRTGAGVVYRTDKFESDTVLQTGSDTNLDGARTGGISSGGFEQLRYQFTDRFWTIARLDGTNDPTNGFSRSALLFAGYRTSANAHVSIEHVLTRDPRTRNDYSLQFQVAY